MAAQLFRVVVPVSDLDVAVHFYQQLLLEDGHRLSPSWHYFQLGHVMLACHDAAAEGLPAQAPNRMPIYIAVDESMVQLRFRAAQLGARELDAEARQLPNGETGLMLSDPGGNRLCLVDSHTMQWSPRMGTAPSVRAPTHAAAGSLLQQDFLNAVKGGELDRVEELLMVDPDLIDVCDRSGASALLLAAYKRHDRVVAHLMAQRGELSLWEAAALGAEPALEALLRREPQRIDEPAPDGYLPLGLACFFGQRGCVDLLLRLGADANEVSRNAMHARPLNSALGQVGEDRAMELTQRLLAAGADPGAVQAGGHTPLHQAAGRGLAGVIELLLAAGADPRAQADNGATPYDLARAAGHARLLPRLHP